MVSLSLTGNTYFDYKVGRRIGAGGFGEIYIGTHVKTGKECALKFETLSSHNVKGKHEAGIYKELSGIVGIPRTKASGIVENSYYLMAIELLGPSLESLFNYCGRKFSLKTVVMVAQQLITRVDDLHHKGYMHRDLKPDNIVVGTGSNRGIIYLIDFGLTKRVKTVTNHHIPYREDKSFIGTTRYASLNAHRRIELSRRDDLESLGYTFVYLLKGKLPWQGLDCEDTNDKNRRVYRIKKKTSTRTLCDGLEPEFADFIRYTRKLPFTQRPDYAYLHSLFDNISKRKGFTMDYMFDWTIKKMAEEAAAKAKETHKPKEDEEKTPPQETVCKIPSKKRKAIDLVCQHYGIIKSKRLTYHRDTNLNWKKKAAEIVCQHHGQPNQQPLSKKSKYDSRAEEMKQALDIVCQYYKQQKQHPRHNNNHITRSEMKKEAANIVCQYYEQQKQHPRHNDNHITRSEMKKEAANIICQYHDQQGPKKQQMEQIEPKQQKRKQRQRKQEQQQQQEHQQQEHQQQEHQQQEHQQQQPQIPFKNPDLIICEKEIENNKQKCL